LKSRSGISQLTEFIVNCQSIVFFGGAGVSTESGLPDFRGAEGLYNIAPEEILSYRFFIRNPKEFYDFYSSNLVRLDVLPNEAHLALKELEYMGKDITVITQNIDGLHHIAGSKKVIELHGTIHRNFCLECGKEFNALYIKEKHTCDDCNGLIRPGAVMYGEKLDDLVVEEAIEKIQEAELMIVAGTSLKVYPAAGMLRYFDGKKLVIINSEPTSKDSLADLVIKEKIGEVMKQVMELFKRE